MSLKLAPIFEDLYTAILGITTSELDRLVSVSSARAEEFLASHSTSPNIAELADHAWIQVMQETSISALRIEREAIAHSRAAFIAVLRSLISAATPLP